MLSPEVHYTLLFHIQVEIDVLAPRGQAALLTSVDCLIVVMRPATVVLSANLIMRLELDVSVAAVGQ